MTKIAQHLPKSLTAASSCRLLRGELELPKTSEEQ